MVARHKIPQRRIAAQLLRCGHDRIWIEPSASAKIEAAITRSDIRRLIADGLIKKMYVKKEGNVSLRRHARKTGKRKGKRYSRSGKKSDWLKIIRPQRRMLAEMKSQMEPKKYRILYKLVKGNTFRSRAHLNLYLEQNKIIKSGKGEKK